MKTYQIDSQPETIFFKNIERIPENDIYKNVLRILGKDKKIIIGEETDRALQFVRSCSYCGEQFEIVYDIDYGVMIHAQNLSLKVKLLNLLEGDAE